MESLADFWHENITTYDLSRRIDFFCFCFFVLNDIVLSFQDLKRLECAQDGVFTSYEMFMINLTMLQQHKLRA